MSGSPSRRASATASVGERQPAVGVARVVELERQPGEQPRAQRRVLAAEQAERLLQESPRRPPRRGRAATSGRRTRARRGRAGPGRRAPARRRRRRANVARAPGDAGALLRRAEREQQLAAQPVVGRARPARARAARRCSGPPPPPTPAGWSARRPAASAKSTARSGALDRRREREVVRELPEVGVELRAAAGDQRLPDPAVQARAAQRGEPVVERRAHERVGERVAPDALGILAQDATPATASSSASTSSSPASGPTCSSTSKSNSRPITDAVASISRAGSPSRASRRDGDLAHARPGTPASCSADRAAQVAVARRRGGARPPR